VTTTLSTPNLDAVTGEVEVCAPPERVFRALTDERQLFQWWGEGGSCKAALWHMDARKGGKWRYQSRDTTGRNAANGVTHFEARGDILEFDPPRLLVYTWIANWHDCPSDVTVVRWELTATRSGTRVKVTHSGLAQQPASRKDYSGGWSGVLELLKKHCER
jgi:uncharacterized protein YndB with AHSA1/START domain